MRIYNPSDLVQGVEMDSHEFNVFVVDRKYRVDLMAFSFNGSCTCDAFARFGMASKLERGVLPSINTECSHIRAAKRFYTYRALAFDAAAYAKQFQRKKLSHRELMIYSNLNLLGQPEAILAVGSGDWLGIR